MRDQKKKQKPSRTTRKDGEQKPVKQNKRAYPEENTYGPGVDDTSMSAGNLVNNPRGRGRTRDLHTKISITGSDDDGQTD